MLLTPAIEGARLAIEAVAANGERRGSALGGRRARRRKLGQRNARRVDDLYQRDCTGLRIAAWDVADVHSVRTADPGREPTFFARSDSAYRNLAKVLERIRARWPDCNGLRDVVASISTSRRAKSISMNFDAHAPIFCVSASSFRPVCAPGPAIPMPVDMTRASRSMPSWHWAHGNTWRFLAYGPIPGASCHRRRRSCFFPGSNGTRRHRCLGACGQPGAPRRAGVFQHRSRSRTRAAHVERCCPRAHLLPRSRPGCTGPSSSAQSAGRASLRSKVPLIAGFFDPHALLEIEITAALSRD